MNELPILVIEKIFSFLSLVERLKCKLVSKQWKLAIETSVGPQSLCIYRRKFPHQVRWCSDQTVIQDTDIVYSNPEKFCNLNSRIDLFKDLRKLCFFSVEMSEFMKDLHLLRKLKVLMIHECFIKSDHIFDHNHRITLESAILEKFLFIVRESAPTIQSLDLNTPELSSLIFWNDHFVPPSPNDHIQVNFRFPLTIRHLECIKFDSNMSVLKNLETLVCQKITCPFSLEDYKPLQRLELFPRKKNELEYIRTIINEKKSLRRDRLEITVCGFRHILVAFKQTNEDTLLSLFDLNEQFLRQVAKQPDELVGHIPWQFNVDFAIFHKFFKKLPKNFFTKFNPIYCVEISDSRRSKKRTFFDPPDVLHLLIKANPKEVRIEYNFSREFYEELSSIQSIEKLDIRDRFENLDYDHFLKLYYLRELTIFSEKLPLGFVAKVFEMKFMFSFTFSYSKFYISLERLRKKYYFYKNVHTKKESKGLRSELSFECLNDMENELNRLKTENAAYLRGCLI